MKSLAGILCLVFFNLPVFSQEKAKKDSVEFHVDGKIFITVPKEQINNFPVSIQVQNGRHKISMVSRSPEGLAFLPEQEVTAIAVSNFNITNNTRVKNYSEL
jgi:hypothetical protein